MERGADPNERGAETPIRGTGEKALVVVFYFVPLFRPTLIEGDKAETYDHKNERNRRKASRPDDRSFIEEAEFGSFNKRMNLFYKDNDL